MLHQGEAAVDVVSVIGLLPLGVGASQDVVRAVIGVIDGAVFGVGGAGQVAARPREGAGLRDAGPRAWIRASTGWLLLYV